MRRLLILLPVVAIATASAAALVVSAGPSGAGAGTTGYTIYFSRDAAAVELPPADVGAAQPSDCDAQLATVDLATGEVTPLPAAPSVTACAGDLAFAPDGTLYGLIQGVTNEGPTAELVRYDLTTGAATLVGTFGPFELSVGGSQTLPAGGITFDGSGTLYALLGAAPVDGFDEQCARGVDALSYCLYRVDDPRNPAASTFVGVSTSSEVVAETLAANCETVYTSTYGFTGDPSSVATVNTETGALDEIGALGDLRYLAGADFDFSGTFWGLVVVSEPGNPFDLSTLDPAGGTPIDTPGPQVTVDGDEFPFFNALAIQPLDCAQPEAEPVVLAPTFTG